MNLTLYKREIKNSIRLIIILSAVITLYVSIIISMYDPEMTELLDNYVELMPELMAVVGMKAGATSLISFMSSYLYGFILLIFPMLFCILRGDGLVSRYLDKGSMVSLMAAPVGRIVIAFTQMLVLITGILILIGYSTILEIVCAAHYFPGELAAKELLILNAGLLSLQLFIGSICFLSSCIFSDTKYSLGVGAGIPILMYVFQMLANTGEKAEKAKYFTFFTLYNPDGILSSEKWAYAGIIILFGGAVFLFGLSILVFSRKEMHI